MPPAPTDACREMTESEILNTYSNRRAHALQRAQATSGHRRQGSPYRQIDVRSTGRANTSEDGGTAAVIIKRVTEFAKEAEKTTSDGSTVVTEDRRQRRERPRRQKP